jgi:hypothetical protein
VEAAGLMYAPRLLGGSFGCSRPIPDPFTQGLRKSSIDSIGPTLQAVPGEQCGQCSNDGNGNSGMVTFCSIVFPGQVEEEQNRGKGIEGRRQVGKKCEYSVQYSMILLIAASNRNH